jgi:hypothetical protein
MSAQHTPGRLMTQVESHAIADTGDSKTLKLMAVVFNALDGKDEADARRLVACWNASEGLSTEDLETAGNSFNGWRLASYAMNDAKAQRDELQKTLMSIEAKVDALIAQRDELLAALKQIASTKPVNGMNPDARMSDPADIKVGWNIHWIARAAIAKAEGGVA